MKTLPKFLLLLFSQWPLALVLVLFGCQIEEDWFTPQPEHKSARLEGIWKSEGYGYILEVKSDTATLYDITSMSCIRKTNLFDGASPNVSSWPIQITKKGSEFIYVGQNTVNEFKFVRINALPEPCAEGGMPPTNNALVNFDVLWNTFNEQYAFFTLRNINWEQARQQYRPRVTEQNLREVFEEMLSPFAEDHVTLVSESGYANRFQAGQTRTFAGLYQEYLVEGQPFEFSEYLEQEFEKVVGNIVSHYLDGNVKTAANDKVMWGKLDGNVGYLLLPRELGGYTDPFDPSQEFPTFKAAVDQAMNDLKDTDGIIIDMRFNSGGKDRVGLELAGRFTNRSQPAWKFRLRNGTTLTAPQTVYVTPTGSFRYAKKVVLLTSIITASAAETFTLTMRQFSQVTTLGENTNGIFSTMLTKVLPNGWEFTLSNEVANSIEGKVFEGTGIAPDVPARFPSLSDRAQGVDPGIEKALSLW